MGLYSKLNMEQAYQGSNKPSYWGTVGFIDHTNNYFEGGPNEKEWNHMKTSEREQLDRGHWPG